MTIPTTDKQHKRALSGLLEKGVGAIGLGAAFLVAPSFLEPSPTTIAIAAGLPMGGWIPMGIGLVLLDFRFSVQTKARKLANLPRRDNSKLESLQQRHGPAVFSPENAATNQTFTRASGTAPGSEVTTK